MADAPAKGRRQRPWSGFRANCTARTPSRPLPHRGGGPLSALLFVYLHSRPHRWGRVGVGVMRTERVDSVETSLIDGFQPPVFECDDAVEAAGEIEVVRRDQCGEPGMTDEIEEGAEDAVAGRVIQVAGRLVAEQDPGVVGERPGDRDALLLAAGRPRPPVPI